MRPFLLFTSFLAIFGLTQAGLLPNLFLKQARSRGYADFLPRSSNQLIKPRQNDDKYVFMHHIVGNTYDYTLDDWRSDIQQIGSGGVDAVALNLGSSSWENGQLQNAYDAGAGSNVKLFLSFDFSAFPCDVNSVVNTVNQFSQHPGQFKVNGRPLISSFMGACLGNNGWEQVKDRTGGYLMPFIEGIEGQFSSWSCLDSWYCWGCAWPQGDANKTTADDHYYLSQISSSTKYAATVSPWIFTHYDYKNFYQRGDDWLIVSRWEQLIAMRDQLPMVEMVTWNDFGESSYFGRIKGDPPAGTTWVDGYSHLPFFELSKYYITAYKTGNYPAISDAIYFWARPHPAQAAASADSLSRPTGYNFAEDSLWVLVFATQSAQVTLTCGSSAQQFTVNSGANKLKIPLSPGKIVVSMSRNGQIIISESPTDYAYNANPDLYNYNVYVGSAKAGPGQSIPPTISISTGQLPSTSMGSATPTTSSVVDSMSQHSSTVTATSTASISMSVPTEVPGTTQLSSASLGSVTPTTSSSMDSTSQFSASVTATSTMSTSVSVSTQAPKPSGGSWKHVGCVAEGTTGGRRALTGSSFSNSDMTPKKCQTLCAGYTFAGVEYGRECYCGNSLTNNGASGNVISSYLCSMPCLGDLSKKCGGDWTLNVYTTSSNIPSSPHPGSQDEWQSLGCYVDSTDRILKGFFMSKPGMTVSMCTTACSDQGYTYAASEYGVECYCGNSLESNGSGVSVDGSQCNMACGGDPSTRCGGSWRANVYKTSALSPKSLVSQKRHVSRKKRHY